MKAALAMIAFVIILATVLTGSLVAVDRFTAPIIARNEELKEKRSVLDALEVRYEPGEVARAFDENVKVLEKTVPERSGEAGAQQFFVSREGTVAFKYSGSGLWGPITGVLAVAPDRKTIRGLTIINQEETPGLGGRIKEREFLDRFLSKRLDPGVAVVAPGKAGGPTEVDGITGATLSCKAFERILNEEAGRRLPLLEGAE
jgi:Na+-transporting NADH:ubiquinone oxidoreductase subunit C